MAVIVRLHEGWKIIKVHWSTSTPFFPAVATIRYRFVRQTYYFEIYVTLSIILRFHFTLPNPYHILFGLKYVTLEVKQSDIMMCWDEHHSFTLSRVLKHVRPFIIKSANSKRDYIHYRWCVIDIPKVSIR